MAGAGVRAPFNHSGPDRERLSKRHGATSIASFREMGILPEALVNYIALLGWAPTGGTREIFKPDELVKEFDLRAGDAVAGNFRFRKALLAEPALHQGRARLIALRSLPAATGTA